jgi:hypothetical protein
LRLYALINLYSLVVYRIDNKIESKSVRSYHFHAEEPHLARTRKFKEEENITIVGINKPKGNKKEKEKQEQR